MNFCSRRPRTWTFLLACLLLFGCSPVGKVQDLVVTFDGESCQYKGPEVIREGKAVIVLNNLTSDRFVHIHVAKLDEGKTWQDFVDYVAELAPSSVRRPAWISQLRTDSVEDNPDAMEYSLGPGMHVIYCMRHDKQVNDIPNGVWPAAPLDVRP